MRPYLRVHAPARVGGGGEAMDREREDHVMVNFPQFSAINFNI